MDLRVSGKDLIKNHLTMSLYNHAEIWADDPSKWPRSFFTNGHILVDAQKMSKSEGNFLMLQGSVTGTGPKGDGNMTWSADSVRFTLCDGGDGLDDANFDSKVANQAVLRLTTEAEWIKEMVAAADGGELRAGAPSFMDRVLLNRVDACVAACDAQYAAMRFKLALKEGFYEMQKARNEYRDYHARAELPMHVDVVKRFVVAQVLMLAPITPHVCDYLWRTVVPEAWPGRAGFPTVVLARFPEAGAVDRDLLAVADYLMDAITTFRANIDRAKNPKKKKKKKKGKKGAAPAPAAPAAPAPTLDGAVICVRKSFPAWRCELMDFLAAHYDADGNAFPKDIMRSLGAAVKQSETMKKEKKKLMKVAAFVQAEAKSGKGADAFRKEMPFSEAQVITDNLDYVTRMLDLVKLDVLDADDEKDAALAKGATNAQDGATPGKPGFHVFSTGK